MFDTSNYGRGGGDFVNTDTGTIILVLLVGISALTDLEREGLQCCYCPRTPAGSGSERPEGRSGRDPGRALRGSVYGRCPVPFLQYERTGRRRYQASGGSIRFSAIGGIPVVFCRRIRDRRRLWGGPAFVDPGQSSYGPLRGSGGSQCPDAPDRDFLKNK